MPASSHRTSAISSRCRSESRLRCFQPLRPSWPGLARPSTPYFFFFQGRDHSSPSRKGVDARTKCGHDEVGWAVQNAANRMIRVAFCIGDYPEPERRLREEVALSYATPEIEIGIVPVRASPYGGLGPAEIQLVAPYYHEAFLRAQEDGYDAVVPLGMLDLGVDGGRSLVEIPVVGPCGAAFRVAAQLGQRFGVLFYSSRTIPRQITQTRHYGMEDWIAGRRAVELELKEMTANKEKMVEAVLRESSSLIRDHGADLI